MNIYITISSIFLLVLGLAWSRKDAFNFLVKIIFFGLGGWGLFLALVAAGCVVRK